MREPVWARIHAADWERLRGLSRFELNIQAATTRELERGAFQVCGLLTQEQVADLRDEGYRIDVLKDFRERDWNAEIPTGNRFESGVDAAIFEGGHANWFNSDEILSFLRQMKATHTDYTELLELGRSWGERECLAIRLRAGNWSGARPTVVFVGGIHADEWGNTEICAWLIYRLLSSYTSGQDLTLGRAKYPVSWIRAILDKLDVVVFPLANPDGRDYTFSDDKFWRKNRRGVDINRNFPFLWGENVDHPWSRQSTKPSHPNYIGPGPKHEPERETRNVIQLLDRFPETQYYMDVHSAGEAVLHGWGHDDNQSDRPEMNFRDKSFSLVRGRIKNDPDADAYKEYMPLEDIRRIWKLADWMRQAIVRVRGKEYKVGQGTSLYYSTTGASDDYAYSRHFNGQGRKIMAFTMEFGEALYPEPPEMIKIIDDVNSAMVMLCCAAVAEQFPSGELADLGWDPEHPPGVVVS